MRILSLKARFKIEIWFDRFVLADLKHDTDFDSLENVASCLGKAYGKEAVLAKTDKYIIIRRKEEGRGSISIFQNQIRGEKHGV